MPLLLERELPVSALARSQSGGVVLVVKNLPASAGDVRDAGSIPGLGRAPGGAPGNPLQYSYRKILWTEKPGGRVGHDWNDLACTHSLILMVLMVLSCFAGWRGEPSQRTTKSGSQTRLPCTLIWGTPVPWTDFQNLLAGDSLGSRFGGGPRMLHILLEKKILKTYERKLKGGEWEPLGWHHQ